jgi:hypothetical protein
MKNHLFLLSVLCVIFSSIGAGRSMLLSGTVVDQDSMPVPRVQVTLTSSRSYVLQEDGTIKYDTTFNEDTIMEIREIKRSLTTLTDANGYFELADSTVEPAAALLPEAAKRNIHQPVFTNGTVTFDISNTSRHVSLRLYSLSGRVIHTAANENFNTGSYSLSPYPERTLNTADGVYYICLKIGNRRYSWSRIIMPQFIQPAVDVRGSKLRRTSLQKSLANPDTLKVMKYAYLKEWYEIRKIAFTGDTNTFTIVLNRKGIESDTMLDTTLDKAYLCLKHTRMYNSWYFLFKGYYSDDIEHIEGGYTEFSNYRVSVDNGNIARMWRSLYTGIFRCNIIINHITKFGTPIHYRTEKGEALFLRALYYWHLVTVWGDVPLVTDAYKDPLSLHISSKEKVWEQIEKDLNTILDNNLLPKSACNVEPGTASMDAARALLGKSLLYQKKCKEAINMFSVLIESGTYQLIGLDSVWTEEGEGSREMIYEVPFSDEGAGSGWAEESIYSSDGTFRNQFIAPNQLGGYQTMFPSQSLLEEFEPEDNRFDCWLFSQGDTLPDGEIYSSKLNKGSYGIRKGLTNYDGYKGQGYGENVPIIRYADIKLMHAECLIAMGNETDAMKHIDDVRRREWLFDTTSHSFVPVLSLMTSKAWNAMEALKHERRIEMCFEVHRYNDIVRWGDFHVLGDTFSSNHTYFPIPQSEIDLSNDNLIQNPGYR